MVDSDHSAAVTATSGTWTLSSVPVWEHNKSYWIVARSSDFAGNVQTAFTVGVDSRSVTFDLQAATASIADVLNGRYGEAQDGPVEAMLTAWNERLGRKVFGF